jgi:hypothetical protein
VTPLGPGAAAAATAADDVRDGFVGSHEFHCAGSAVADLDRPIGQALADDDDGRHADPVRPHGGHDRAAVRPEDLEAERFGVRAAELEDVTDLDPAPHLEVRAALGTRVAGAHLRGVDEAVGLEVPTGDEFEDVSPRHVGTGHPRRALDDARVDEEAERSRRAECARPDVALDERRAGGELVVAEGRQLGRCHRRLEPMQVDFAIARYADRQRLPSPVGVHEHHEHVLQRVSRHPGTAAAVTRSP